MTENFEEKLNRLTELLEKQIQAFGDLNDSTEKTEKQQQKALEDSILQEKGYKKVGGNLISIEEDRIKTEERLTKQLDKQFGKDYARNAKLEAEYNKQLKAINDVVQGANEISQAQKDNLAKQKESNEYIAAVQKTEYNKQLTALNEVIKGSIEITDAQKENLVKLKQSKEYMVSQQASEFKKQAESLGAVVGSNGKLLEVNGKIVTDSILLSEEQKKQLASLKSAKKVQERQEAPGKTFGQDAERYKDTTNILTDFSGKLKESASSSVGWTASIQLAEAAIVGMSKGITVFTSSIYKGERGAAVTANALNELTKEVGNTMTGIGTAFAIFSFFMPGGIIVKGLKIVGGLLGALGGQLIKGYGELQKLGAEQNDALFKSYNKLAASGLGAANGLEGVIDTVHTLNMSVPEIEKFTELLTNNSKELKLLGATAGEGAQNFAKVAGELSKSQIGEQLERLGITAEDQREHTLRYMANQTRMGLAQGKTQQELIRGSQQYIEELDKIAMLTGASRKDQEEARAAVMAENELRAAMYEAEKNKDFELLGKLKQAAELAANLKVMGDTRGMTGVSKYAAAGFNPTDEVSGAAMQTYQEVLNNIAQGKGGSASANLTTALKGLQTSMDNYAGAAKYGGDFKALQTADMAKGADMVLAGKRFEEEKLKNPNVTIDQVLELMQKNRKDGDERLTATVEGNRMQQAAAQVMDKAAFQYNDAAKIHAAASTKFKEAVDTFAKIAGAKPVAGGTNVNASGTTAPTTTTAPTAPAKPTGNLGSGTAGTPPGMTPGVSPLRGKPITPAPSVPSSIPRATSAPPNAGATKMGAMADQRREDLDSAYKGVPSGPLAPSATQKQMGESSELSKIERELNRFSKSNNMQLQSNKDYVAKLETKRKQLLAVSGNVAEPASPEGTTESAPTSPLRTTRGVKTATATTPDDVMKLIKFQGDALGNREHFDGLDPYVKQNFMDMIAEYGKPVQINAAMRDTDEQQSLYDKWIANGRIGNPVARPGTSKHNFGRALDLNSSQVADLASSGLLSKYGFNTIPRDPPHIEMARFGGVFSGPESGYPVMLHGDQETVVTKPQFNEMAEGVKKESVTTAMSDLGSTTTTNPADSPAVILQDLFSMMEDKFDSMIDKLTTGNDIQSDLLKHSRV